MCCESYQLAIIIGIIDQALCTLSFAFRSSCPKQTSSTTAWYYFTNKGFVNQINHIFPKAETTIDKTSQALNSLPGLIPHFCEPPERERLQQRKILCVWVSFGQLLQSYIPRKLMEGRELSLLRTSQITMFGTWKVPSKGMP